MTAFRSQSEASEFPRLRETHDDSAIVKGLSPEGITYLINTAERRGDEIAVRKLRKALGATVAEIERDRERLVDNMPQTD